jgi:hypothetical protein
LTGKWFRATFAGSLSVGRRNSAMEGFDLSTAGPGGVRLEATLRPLASSDPAAVRGLDVLPSIDGLLHVLLSPTDLVDVVSAGWEATVFAIHPIAPLDPALVMDDDAAQAWIDERLAIIEGRRS